MMLLLQANATGLLRVNDLQLLAPELILTVFGCLALVMEVVLPYRKTWIYESTICRAPDNTTKRSS